ncbi:hypothetical protein Rcae01_01650 [Novipirellula caenicola]|uniref:Uncharacterized protein n=1 Tax=Novipirellula caenicola TaxID=1536901 RepID=A0ABP9VRU6_9BACT
MINRHHGRVVGLDVVDLTPSYSVVFGISPKKAASKGTFLYLAASNHVRLPVKCPVQRAA